MYEVTIVIFLLICIAMVALILVQQGKGASMGASFGAGASNTVFGSAGSGNFLTRSTWLLIVVFFGICLFIGWMQKDAQRSVKDFSNIAADTAGAVVEQSTEAAETPAVGMLPEDAAEAAQAPDAAPEAAAGGALLPEDEGQSKPQP
ncbi:MAG: preprotein translocase subunit SecG [Succinivibrio sp.]|nr:preprotein translocase subunit SecG [Succinivibrio sp.]